MNNKYLTLTALILFALSGCLGELAIGEVLTFDYDSGDNMWLDKDNWTRKNGSSPDNPPEEKDNAIIVGGTAVVDASGAVARSLLMQGAVTDKVAVNSGGELSLERVRLGSQPMTGGTLEVDDGSLMISKSFLIGEQMISEGTVSLLSGSITLEATVTAIEIGNGLGTTGNIEISGGSMVATSTAFQLGVLGGTGNLVMRDGTLQVDTLDASGGSADISLIAGVLSIDDSTTGGFLYGPSTLLSMEQGILAWNLSTGIEDMVNAFRSTQGDTWWANGLPSGTYSDFGYDFMYVNEANTDVLYVDNSGNGGGLNGQSFVWVEQLVAIPEPATLSMIAIVSAATVRLRRKYRYR